MLNIYVANLSKYNEGILKGEWIHLPTDSLEEQIQNILGKDEEVAIHDYETDIESLDIHEFQNIYELNDLAKVIEGVDLDILSAIVESTGYELKQCIEILESGDYSYYSDVKSREDLGYAIVESGCFGEIPKHLENYIDYEAIGRDANLEGYYICSNGIAIHVY